MAQFEGYERREAKILAALKNYGISSIDECKEICAAKGIDPYTIVQETQPICFENAKWAYTVGSAIAIKEAERTGDKSAAAAAANIGIGLQAFCIPGSVIQFQPFNTIYQLFADKKAGRLEGATRFGRRKP